MDYRPAIDAFRVLTRFFEDLQREQRKEAEAQGQELDAEQREKQRQILKTKHTEKKLQIAELKQLVQVAQAKSQPNPVAKLRNHQETTVKVSPKAKKSAIEEALASIDLGDLEAIDTGKAPTMPAENKAIQPSKPVLPITYVDPDDPRLK